MAYEIVVGLAILAVAIIIAWLLARMSQKGAGRKEVPCPHCGERMPREAHVCPRCSKQINVCHTCKAYILDSEGRCEVCGETITKPGPTVHLCPKCGWHVEGHSRLCPKCGEQYWSPIVAQK